jgi:hypothetical protein
MMSTQYSIAINRPITEVFDVATCLRRCVVWRNALFKSAPETDEPVGVGTTAKQEWLHFGTPWSADLVVTAYDPPHRFGYKGKSLFEYDAEYLFETAGEGTQLTVTIMAPEFPEEFKSRIPGGQWESFTHIDWEKDLTTLKVLMEGDKDLWEFLD